MQEIKKPSGIHYSRGYARDLNNPQVYTTQEGIEDIKNLSSGIHYSRGYARD